MNETIEALVRSFVVAAENHHAATLTGDYKRTNREADHIHAAFLKLRELGPAAREALIQVALTGLEPAAGMAATYSLKYDPDRSLAVLKRLAKAPGILGFGASEAIKRWKSGEWQLE